MTTPKDIREAVRERYAQQARSAGAGCCGSSDPVTRELYGQQEIGWLPTEASLLSLGCGNPTALAELRPGEAVLDLGSGAGLDVLLSARRVGPTGKAYGLDMTDEMLTMARRNQKLARVTNAEFLKGVMEDIPLPDSSVDVVISNCVVNLSPDKDRVLREAFRVLKPGGRLAISDIVVRGEVPEALRRDIEAWAGCIAGAMSDAAYTEKLRMAGFEAISIETTRTYSLSDVQGTDAWKGVAHLPAEVLEQAVARFTSAFVRARKPAQT
ncbi:MAG: arsenite methyltransferase [Chloroflexi bacterium]|nr:arsenite methyltransferase [Chloroflexota bacterium]